MTIGYEGLSLEEFFGLLREGRVERIVDVRQMPLSRKKGFSKNVLRERNLSMVLRHFSLTI